jgi:hypothetical protein
VQQLQDKGETLLGWFGSAARRGKKQLPCNDESERGRSLGLDERLTKEGKDHHDDVETLSSRPSHPL